MGLFTSFRIPKFRNVCSFHRRIFVSSIQLPILGVCFLSRYSHGVTTHERKIILKYTNTDEKTVPIALTISSVPSLLAQFLGSDGQRIIGRVSLPLYPR